MRSATLLLIFASVLLSAFAQMFLKLGVTRADGVDGSSALSDLGNMLASPLVLVGLGLYGAGALLWLFVLGKVPLSVAYPFVGAGFIVTAMIAVVLLGEQFTASRAVGTLLIAIGCVLVARSA
jgi:multidrug transporter EmrE-like cation transporter